VRVVFGRGRRSPTRTAEREKGVSLLTGDAAVQGLIGMTRRKKRSRSSTIAKKERKKRGLGRPCWEKPCLPPQKKGDSRFEGERESNERVGYRGATLPFTSGERSDGKISRQEKGKWRPLGGTTTAPAKNELGKAQRTSQKEELPEEGGNGS